jgi:hypothetical protein
MRQPKVRDTATVTVSKPVNGQRSRRAPKVTRSANRMVEHIKVRSDVMAVARQVRRPGQVIVIESAECVTLVNRRAA